MTLTLLTVNYNGTADTLRLLRSLEQQTDDRFDIIVVDNDSDDAQRESLGAYAASSPLNIDVIYSSRNLGFSGGNNIGIRKALAQKVDWILLINNDTTVATDFVASLKRTTPSHAALVGVPLDEGQSTAYAGYIRWLCTTLPHAHTPVSPHHGYAIGAGMLVHRSVFERIGLLDESYFLYFEDADFSLRVRRAHIPVLFATAPVIRHYPSSSASALGSPLLLRYHMRNAIRLHRLHAPLWARFVLPFWLSLIASKQLFKLIVGKARPQSVAILRGITDGLYNRTGMIRTRPIIAVECESLEDTSWGMARQVRGLLNALVEIPAVRRKYEVVAYFKSRVPPDEAWLQHTHVRAVIVRPFRWIPASFSLYFYVFFPMRLWWDRPVATYIANYMLPLIFRGTSIVMLTEDIWHEMRGRALPFRYRIAYRIFATWAARRATRIMAISHASARGLAELFHIPVARLAVNELAVPTAQPVRPRDGRYILYVAQSLPRRHLRETILAFERIAVRKPDLHLLAVGPDKYDPPVIEALVRQANDTLGRDAVSWQTRLTDAELHAAYAGAQCFVYVSDMEAFGLPPVEALAYGVPSVLMDAPVHREIFGDHAFYTPDADIGTLSATIERALTDTAHRDRIRHAAQSIVSRYTWEKHAQRMIDMIESIS